MPFSFQMDKPQKRNSKTHEQLCRKKPGYIKTDSGKPIVPQAFSLREQPKTRMLYYII